MSEFAWVTLATNDSYSLGALVLAHSLRQVATAHQLAVLVTPGVTNAMREKLAAVFNVVKVVNILDSKDEANLRLLQRPELGITFTKLHCWRLTQFKKCVFLDADTMVLANVDELFEREELSAAPDVGWPDCFNSGVFVYRPSEETYANLVQFAIEKGSFDGGDQGLLNLYFSDWAHKDISKHLPFIYNMCSTACYSYLPAFKQFGGTVKIIHFIGNAKPWLQYFDTESRQVQVTPELRHLQGIVQQWWNIFCSFIHPVLSSEMTGLAGAFAQLTLGVPRTAEQNLLEDHLRRQGWEVGNIDYMGRDSFDNIWSKICMTLSSPPEPAHSPPPSDLPTAAAKEPSPPPTVKQVEKSVDVAELTTSAEEITPAKEAKPVADLPITQPVEIPCEPSKPQESQILSAEPPKPSENIPSKPTDVPIEVPAEETIKSTEATVASQQLSETPTSKIVAPAVSAQQTQIPVESTVVTESTPSITPVSTQIPIEPTTISQPVVSPKTPTTEATAPVLPAQTQISTEPTVVCKPAEPEAIPSHKTSTSDTVPCVLPVQTQIPTQPEIVSASKIPTSETVTPIVPAQTPPIESPVSEPLKAIPKSKSEKKVETSETLQQEKTESTSASAVSDVPSQVPKPISPPVTPTDLHKQKPSTPTEQKQDVCSKPAQTSTKVSQKPQDTSKPTESQTKPVVATGKVETESKPTQGKTPSEKPAKKESQPKSSPPVKEAPSAASDTASAGDAQGPTPPPRKSGTGGSGNKKGGKGKK